MTVNRVSVRGTTSVFLVVVSAVFSVAAFGTFVGCAVAPPHGRLEPRPIELYPMRATTEGVTVACEPLTEAPLVKSLFGDDIVALGVLPIMVVVQNQSPSSVAVRDQDVQLEIPRRSQAEPNREQLEHTGLPLGQAVLAFTFSGVIGVLMARGEHDQAEYDRQNRVSEVAFRSATLVPGQSTSGVVYFPIDRSWLADTPDSLVVRAQQLGPGTGLVIRIPLGGLAQPVARGAAR